MLNSFETTRRRLMSQGRKILNLTSGNPLDQGFIFPIERLAQSYVEYFKKPHYQPHPKGLLSAREALAHFYQAQGLILSPENFILTSGTSESFFYLFRLLGKAGENFLAPRPGYPLLEHLAELARVDLKFYDLKVEENWAINFESLEHAADEKTRGLLLVSPHNPTGAVSSEAEIKSLAQFCREKNLPLICDEVFSDFYFGPETYPRPAALEEFPLIFTLNGISKRFALPMMKLGWITASGTSSRLPEILDQLETYADALLSTHIPIQSSLPTLLENSQDFVDEYVVKIKQQKSCLADFLKDIPGIHFMEPQGGFYLIFEVLNHQGLEEEAWVLKLLEETGILVHPGYFFDLELPGRVFGVMSFLTKQDVLEEGLEKLKKFLS